MAIYRISKNGNDYGLYDLSTRGFFVTTTNDIECLCDSFGDECKLESLGDRKFYFEFVMPFHTVNEATIRLKSLLSKAGYKVPVM